MTDPRPAGTGALRDGRHVREMFGRIVPRYDAMNRLMTGGRDVAWRRLAVREALARQPADTAYVLDVATGTGDLAFALVAGGAAAVIGADFARPMLAAAAAKRPPDTADDGRTDGVRWVVADALALPFPDASFDACTVAFGLRNMADFGAALREMGRVLRPGGRLVCLELTPYRRPVLGRLFGWYFARVVPLVGGILSGDRDAYRYLPSSVAAFPTAAALTALFGDAGFADIRHRLLGGGTVALHVGTKRAPSVPVETATERPPTFTRGRMFLRPVDPSGG